MKTLQNYSFTSEKPWQTNYNATDQSMELYFTEDIAATDIDTYLKLVGSLVNFVPVRTLIINDNKIQKGSLGLDWEIIEASWEAIYRNGGKKIIVIHQSDLPSYVKKMYSQAMDQHGVPIKLEFRSGGSKK
jgi:hypothetical protein